MVFRCGVFTLIAVINKKIKPNIIGCSFNHIGRIILNNRFIIIIL